MSQSFNSTIVKKSLAVKNLPARMQIISQDPLIILDGAHNVPAIKALINNLQVIRQQRRVVVLYAAMADKERAKILAQLENFAGPNNYYNIRRETSSKTNDYPHLSAKTTYLESWPIAFAQAVTSLDSDSILVICGSLHFASVILELLSNK